MTTDQEYFIMNAAGTCKTLEDVLDLCKVENLSAILLGSITKPSRLGNSGNTYHYDATGGLNSLGMNNGGQDYYERLMFLLAEKIHGCGKKFGVSVAAIDDMRDYGRLAEMCILKNADFVELNGGCPNIWDEGKQHRVLTFDLKGCENMFRYVGQCVPADSTIYFKVSPIADRVYLQELAAIINAFPIIAGVTATNTFPNGHGRNNAGEQVISVGKGYAGVSGPPLKYISKGQVLMWKEYLSPEKVVIAAGGIDCGQDILDYEANGATKFQIATAFMNQGPGIFAEVLADAVLLKEKRVLAFT